MSIMQGMRRASSGSLGMEVFQSQQHDAGGCAFITVLRLCSLGVICAGLGTRGGPKGSWSLSSPDVISPPRSSSKPPPTVSGRIPSAPQATSCHSSCRTLRCCLLRLLRTAGPASVQATAPPGGGSYRPIKTGANAKGCCKASKRQLASAQVIHFWHAITSAHLSTSVSMG